jgi:GNAT superfamily N-acetyltransferase
MTDIRPARPADVPGIVATHASDIRVWYRWDSSGRRRVVRRPGALSPRERWLNGGPWMSEVLFAHHLAALRRGGHEAWVAEEHGRVVGEGEILFGEDLAFGPAASLDVLNVRWGHRRRGLGRALVRAMLRSARGRGARCVTVIPERDAIGFYRRVGLDETFLRFRGVSWTMPGHFDRDTPSVVPTGARRVSGPSTRHRLLLFGRPPSFVQAWKLNETWPAAVDPGIVETGRIPGAGAIYALRPSLAPRSVRAWIWARGPERALPALRAVARRACRRGFDRLLTEAEVGLAGRATSLRGVRLATSSLPLLGRRWTRSTPGPAA